MSEPTEAQIKEFWEWCGLTLLYPPKLDNYHLPQWGYKGENLGDLDIDLNNLFKYAVPFLKGRWAEWWIIIQPSKTTMFIARIESILEDKIEGIAETPALALFWALWQVKEKSNE